MAISGAFCFHPSFGKCGDELTTWSARTWLTFKTQKVSVALHRAVALELANALGLSAAVDAP